MIVGKESTGKTCLLKRLLKEDISNVTSTDGVDTVVRRCKINIADGSWIIGKDIDDDKVDRIKRALSPLVMQDDSTTQSKVNLYKNNDKKILVLPEDLLSNVFSTPTVNTTSNQYALCELWDFAGQKEFYATHQAFLTSSAVYLVVANMEDDIRKQGLGQCFADYQNIGEYVDFWFDSIHCHRTTDKRARNMHLDPPIILVFTGKDKYDKEADLKKRKKELNDQLDQVLGLQSKYHHLHKKWYLSNLTDTDEEFVKLQHAISETARKMDNWGNAFPLKWILLEHLIEINKNDGKNIINLNDMSKLAKHHDINILEKDELLLFLRFQHNVGNIIFFENIPDLIILKPQWLADAFRCLVSDRIDDSSLHYLEDWTLFTRQGKISESLITKLFETKDGSQFLGQKNNLHKVMEKLDILVKIENSNYYIMPSQMPSSTFEDICREFGILTPKCERTSWLCFKFIFLPPSFFNHISAWFIKEYIPSNVASDSTSVALYRGICVFDIDRSGVTKILVTMSTDTIALQVLSFSEKTQTFG
ncbi:probable serine/threonine-protein kinase pats1 [Mytilus trossulus]|uniref:probable serine/threonine-protein kinase pats1 n=1 Tax=Mytilus trossulus TaxID=6551 RepID=UPI0030072CF7